MSRPHLLLVPFVTELEWETIRPALEEWADVATYDAPGVGDEQAPEVLTDGPSSLDPVELLRTHREAVAVRGIEEAERHGWEEFLIVADSYGIPSAVRTAELAAGRATALAIGHATLSRTGEGERPTMVREVFDAMGAMLRTDREAFIAAAVAQVTQGAVDAELAQRWLERFPDAATVNSLWAALGRDPEPVGDRIERLGLPLLLSEHAGCLVETREGFEDIVAAFPDAATVSCPEACAASPAFAEALREFAEPS
ncbi:MAG: hypothetical protein ACRDK9_00725 [Solirubrobacterales bacterium]